MTDHDEGTPAETAQAEAGDVELRALIESADPRTPFGPLFFLTQLRGFVRDRCPDEAGGLPTVELWLHSGEKLDLCHVMGVAPLCVALAVEEDRDAAGSRAMRTEIVPYGLIARVTIRAAQPGRPGFGFRTTPAVTIIAGASPMSPEEALRAAATARP